MKVQQLIERLERSPRDNDVMTVDGLMVSSVDDRVDSTALTVDLSDDADLRKDLYDDVSCIVTELEGWRSDMQSSVDELTAALEAEEITLADFKAELADALGAGEQVTTMLADAQRFLTS